MTPAPAAARTGVRTTRPTSVVRAFLLGLFGPPGVSDRDPLGPLGEKLAADHLRKLGYRVLGVNLRIRGGEADLLAQDPDGQTIVLVEVKARRAVDPASGKLAPPPEVSVHAHKQARLRRILAHLIRANRWHDRPARIDVIAVEMPATGNPANAIVRHTPNAVALNPTA